MKTEKRHNSSPSENKKQGEKGVWKKVFTGSGERLKEVVENYKSMGYLVKVEDAKPEDPEKCTVCFRDGECKDVYVMEKPGETKGLLEDLFEDFEE